MMTYSGSCHCGGISFSFQHEKIGSGLRCNCSICKRKGAVMSDFTLTPEELKITDQNDSLRAYQFSTEVAIHYFCSTCGIYPFHKTVRKPGNFRVNLGCVNEVNTNALKIDIFDGKNI